MLYIAIDFSYNRSWDSHISICYINLSARRMLFLSVLHPSLEYGSEVWERNKFRAASLVNIMLGVAKFVISGSSKTLIKISMEICAWKFCKVGVIKIICCGGTRSLTCFFLDIQKRVKY